MLEPEDFRDDREEQRPLSAEAESDEDRRYPMLENRRVRLNMRGRGNLYFVMRISDSIPAKT